MKADKDVVLEAAGVHEARLLLITVPNVPLALRITDSARRLSSDLHVIARATDVDQVKALHEHGVYEAVQPEFEASLEFLRQALIHLDYLPAQIERFTDVVRHELYSPLYTEGGQEAVEELLASALDLSWIEVLADSALAGQSIAAAHIRSRTGASVVAVIREGQTQTNPDPDFTFASGDRVAIVGDVDQARAFRALMEA